MSELPGRRCQALNIVILLQEQQRRRLDFVLIQLQQLPQVKLRRMPVRETIDNRP